MTEMANTTLSLRPVEQETLRRAAVDRQQTFDGAKTDYTTDELGAYGLVREGYNREELREMGIEPAAVSSFDPLARDAERLLPIAAPFGSGIRKWQLPIDMMPIRVSQTVFPPNTKVSSHVHPPASSEAPGGGLRIVVKGSISYNGKTYRAADWFFVPNGNAYEFTSDPSEETVVFYTYAFFGFEEGNRFSHPMESAREGGRQAALASLVAE